MMNTLQKNAANYYYLFLLISIIGTSFLAIYCGFYWDDWNFHTIIFNRDYDAIKSAFSDDRPLSHYNKILTKIFFPESPIYFQLFLVSTKLLFSFVVYKIIKILEFCNDEIILKSIPFLVFFYPGFSHDSVSVTFIIIYILYSLYFLSFYLTLLSIEKIENKSIFYLLCLSSLAITILIFFHAEYFLGMEIYRMMIIYHTIKILNPKDYSWKEIARISMPYLATAFFLAIYRGFFFESSRPALQSIDVFNFDKTGFLIFTVDNYIKIIGDIYESLIGVWINSFRVDLSSVGFNDSLHVENIISIPKVKTFIYLTILIFSGIFGYLLSLKNIKKYRIKNNILFYSFLGVLSLVFIWAGNRQIILNHQHDRYSLQVIMSSVLFLIFLLYNIKHRYFFLSFLIGFCICKTIDNRINFIKDWERQKAFFEQIFWRFPEIEKGSVIAIDGMDFIIQRDKAFSVPLNYMYSKKLDTEFPEYWIDFYPGVNDNMLKLFENDTMIKQEGAFIFESDPEKIIWVNFDQQSCMKVRDSERKDTYFSNSFLSSNFKKNKDNYKNFKHKIPNEKIATIFGSDFGKKDCWCYFFEKADYYYSNEDWSEVLNIFSRVIDTNYRPIDKREWLIFYESAIILNEMNVIDLIESMVYDDKNSHIFNLKSGPD